MNFTSSHREFTADIDHVTVDCHVSYLAASHWRPYIECQPNIPGQTEVIRETPGNVTYTKSFNATPEIDGVVLSCVAKFNATGYKPDKGQADNAPQDVHLWKSAPLQVQCTQLFRVTTC